MKSWMLAAAAAARTSVVAGVGPAHADVGLDRAVEQEGVLVDDRDHAADLLERQLAQVVAAEADRALDRIVEAQQQAHDRRLAAARRADHADALARRHREAETVMHQARGAGIAEAHAFEREARRERLRQRRRRRVLDQRPAVENLVEALRRRHADHALVQHRAQLAHRAEDLDAQHQDDEQRRQLHRAGLDPERAERERGGRAAGDRAVGDAARQHVGRQHPHGALEQALGLAVQVVAARLALVERLQRREALDRIEELGGEGRVGLLAIQRARDVELVPQRRREQGDQREHQHDRRDRQVDEGDGREDQDRRQQGDQELRQELAEIGLELLDPVDQRQRERAGALAPDRARAERGDLLVDDAAQRHLHPRGGLVRDHGAPMLEHAAQHHHRRDGGGRQQQLREALAGEQGADQPAQQAEARDAEGAGDETDQHGPGDAQPDAAGEGPKPRLDMHD